MLKKLLKYDLKWIYKLIIIFYSLAIFSSFLTRIFNSIDNSLLCSIIGSVCSGFTIAMLISSLINTLMRSWVRFERNIYKDESYLTHTLPVSKKNIYLSKALSAIITSFTTVLVIILCLFICYYSKENFESLKSIFSIAANTYNTTTIRLIFIISLLIFLEINLILLIGYNGIILGYRSNKNKLAKSIVWGFGLYIGTQTANLLIIIIIALFNPEIMNFINTTSNIEIHTIKNILIMSITLYSIYNIIYYLLGKKNFEKGVNVD